MRGRIGADREEGDKAEIEKACESDLEIEPHPHQDVEPDEHHHLPDIGARDDREQDEQENEQERPAPPWRSAFGRAKDAMRRSRAGPRSHVVQTKRRPEARTKIISGAFERKAFPGVDRLTQRIDRPAGLHHDLDEFLKDAEDDDEGEADDHRLAQALGRQRQRGAKHGEQRPHDNQNRAAERRAQAEGQRLEQSRRQGDEDLAKRKGLHRQRKEREKAASDASRKQGSAARAARIPKSACAPRPRRRR